MDEEVRKDNMEFTTPAGKKIVTKREPKNGYLYIQFTSGGEIPVELQGYFTSPAIAEKAIRVYLETKSRK